MTVIIFHILASMYGIMGIKLTALIWMLQINTRFSISNYRGIKKTKLVNFKIFPFVHPFIKWGSFEGPFRLAVQQKNLHIWKWHVNGHQMRYLRSWSNQKWKLWTTLRLAMSWHQQNSLTSFLTQNLHSLVSLKQTDE